MLLLRLFKPVFAFGVLIIVSNGQPTKKEALNKIRRILMDFEKIINTAEKRTEYKSTNELAKRQLTNVYPCSEIKEEVSVADLMRRRKMLPNTRHNEMMYVPSKVVTFKCRSMGFGFNMLYDAPCRCKQRYRQIHFQARQSMDCRLWKLIPVTIEDGCHCERIFKR